MAFPDVVAEVRPAVVGMGLLLDENDPLSVVILGTGFLVHPNGWIMTNRHVAEQFMGQREGRVGVRNALARAVLFVPAQGRAIPGREEPAVGGIGALPCPIVEIAMPPDAPDCGLNYESEPDLAVCRISTEDLPRWGVERLPHLALGDSQNVRAGDEVGTLGFPFGLTIAGDAALRQMTPITQKGVVAAVLPFNEVPNPHAFQLDISINGGSSGSPLFMASTGEVVGVVFAARVRPHPVEIDAAEGPRAVATIPLPTGFGYAVPINRYHQRPRPAQRLPDLIRH